MRFEDVLANHQRSSLTKVSSHHTYPLIKVIATELHGRVGYDPDAVGAVPTHKASPSFLFPHFAQSLPHGQLVRISPSTLDLHENLESLEG